MYSLIDEDYVIRKNNVENLWRLLTKQMFRWLKMLWKCSSYFTSDSFSQYSFRHSAAEEVQITVKNTAASIILFYLRAWKINKARSVSNKWVIVTRQEHERWVGWEEEYCSAQLFNAWLHKDNNLMSVPLETESSQTEKEGDRKQK